jgi:glycosyltransferase involved in cell wall biosynthesis
MKILIVSLLRRPVNNKITAARPRMIYELVRKLVEKGHEVSILGTGDSEVEGAKIVPVIPRSFMELQAFENPFYAEVAYLSKMAKMLEEMSGEYDIVHNHTFPEFINLLVEKNLKCPMVTTIHAQMTPEMDDALSHFKESNLVCISNSAKDLAKNSQILKVVYNGIDTSLFKYEKEKQDYLLWIGRLSKARDKDGNFLDPKGVKWAIKLAKETGSKLKFFGNVEDIEFFDKEVKPNLNDDIQFVAPVSKEQPLGKEDVVKYMQGAKAFLMTVNWAEPFGLVMAEAMSCGTPVIGFDNGSVPELVEDGKTGYVVKYGEGIDGLKAALGKIDSIKTEDCRERVEKLFSIDAMVDNYENIYQDLVKEFGEE